MSPFIFKVPAVIGFQQMQILSANDKVVSDQFGYSAAIDGNVAVFGARYADPGGVGSAGAAYVFEFDGSVWNQVQKLVASDAQNGDQFGWSVAISGGVIVVGAYFADPGGITTAGAAYVFEKSGTWPSTETQKFTASDKALNNQFGIAVSVSGTTAVIGANGANGTEGAAYIFVKGGSWLATETTKIVASDAVNDDQFANAVSISGNIIVVGAKNADPVGQSAAGAVYVYEKGGSWPTTETVKLTASDKTASDFFGFSVAIEGTTIVVGAIGADPGGVGSAGAGYVFEKSGTWPVTETIKILASDPVSGDLFGFSVSISAGTIIVGVHRENGWRGAVYVYEKAGTWPVTETEKLVASVRIANDQVGFAVGISGTTIVASAYQSAPDGVSDSGSAFVFSK